jgi:hypothetical protein
VGQWWASLYNDPNWFVFYGHDAIRNVKLTANTAGMCVNMCVYMYMCVRLYMCH